MLWLPVIKLGEKYTVNDKQSLKMQQHSPAAHTAARTCKYFPSHRNE